MAVNRRPPRHRREGRRQSKAGGSILPRSSAPLGGGNIHPPPHVPDPLLRPPAVPTMALPQRRGPADLTGPSLTSAGPASLQNTVTAPSSSAALSPAPSGFPAPCGRHIKRIEQAGDLRESFPRHDPRAPARALLHAPGSTGSSPSYYKGSTFFPENVLK